MHCSMLHFSMNWSNSVYSYLSLHIQRHNYFDVIQCVPVSMLGGSGGTGSDSGSLSGNSSWFGKGTSGRSTRAR